MGKLRVKFEFSVEVDEPETKYDTAEVVLDALEKTKYYGFSEDDIVFVYWNDVYPEIDERR